MCIGFADSGKPRQLFTKKLHYDSSGTDSRLPLLQAKHLTGTSQPASFRRSTSKYLLSTSHRTEFKRPPPEFIGFGLLRPTSPGSARSNRVRFGSFRYGIVRARLPEGSAPYSSPLAALLVHRPPTYKQSVVCNRQSTPTAAAGSTPTAAARVNTHRLH